MAFSNIEQFYSDDGYCGFKDDFTPSRYDDYVNFVKKNIIGSVHEIGSGLGEAAYALHLSSINVTATDIFPNNAISSFKKMDINIPVEFLNSNKIDKKDNSIENYSLYQVLEHIETPQQTISEIYRTLKPGGQLVIVGPNLISPLSTIKAFIFGLTGKWETPFFIRKDRYKFPFGSTVLEIFPFIFINLYRTLIKLFFRCARKPIFREPCLEKPAISDSDAVFLMNPLDVRELLINNGFSITSYQEERKMKSFTGSTWIVGQK